MVLCCPGTDHIKSAFAQKAIVRTAQLLAVNGDHLPRGDCLDHSYPSNKTILKVLRIKCCKNTSKSIMRWNAIWQFQKRFQPDILLMTKHLDFCPSLYSAHNGTYRYCNNIDQLVLFGTIDAWIT